ncbi:acyltransferase family protein [Ornithinibacillus halotolerans]|uniref:Acyltransferase n=1 Tax=Ornithinibacillus halotolerans TaxID=1274357 RepID=A0A916W3N9_9BACI|nr:acyltransferase family protein [Ornithinibacillus halotolerans]GGA63806.1 acyltransferase [Ornithinibacillus halotolerans]
MERNAFFDNAKLLLIFLVVFGHMIQPYITDSNGMHTLYTWIYTFHMPAFIFLSGFFAKGFGNKGYLLKLGRKLLLPYLIFQLIYSSYYYLIGKSNWLTDIFYPHWSLWFLISLFCWHLLLILFKRMPAYVSVSVAVILGITVGYVEAVGHTFSLSRTFVFFPFFLLGFWLKEEHIMWLKQRSIKVISIVIMAVIAMGIYFAPEINTGWLLASKSYFDLGMDEFGGIARILVYVTSALMAASVFAWIPTKRNSVTHLGERTLYVYLLHGFIIQYFRAYDVFTVNHLLDVLGLVGVSVIVVLVLSSKPVLTLSQPFIECKTSYMKKYMKKFS